MADILVSRNVYQGTATPGSNPPTDAHFQICAIANINASNQLEATFWINRNGERVDSDLGTGGYVVRDKNGTAVAGLVQSGISPDVNGYYKITPVSAALIYDLTHYVMEINISVSGSDKTSSIGIVIGE